MNSKIIFAGLCLLAISCTKKLDLNGSIVESETPIEFNTLVAPATKATVDYDYDDFIVTGVYGNPNLSSFDTSEGHLYMNEVTVTKTTKMIESESYTTWVADKYFWPRVGKLSFGAYYPTSFKENLEIGATGVTSGDGYLSFENGDVDFLYSDRVENVSKYASPTDEKKVDVESPASHRYGVQITFHHALSKIEFQAQLSTALPVGSTAKINSIQIVGLDYKAKFAQNLAATFAGEDGTPTWTIASGEAVPDPATATYNRTVTAPASITATGENFDNLTLDNLYVLPQDFTSNNDAGIIVNYTITFAGSGIAETVTSPKVLIKDLTYSNSNGTKFVAGKKYIYKMVLGFEPIYFNPSVEDWDIITVTGGAITL